MFSVLLSEQLIFCLYFVRSNFFITFFTGLNGEVDFFYSFLNRNTHFFFFFVRSIFFNRYFRLLNPEVVFIYLCGLPSCVFLLPRFRGYFYFSPANNSLFFYFVIPNNFIASWYFLGLLHF